MRALPTTILGLQLLLILILFPPSVQAQAPQPASNEEVEELRATVRALQQRVESLEERLGKQPADSSIAGSDAAAALTAATRDLRPAPPQPDPLPVAQTAIADPILPTQLPGGATLNYYLDGYYEYNLNAPIGRVNYLRAYDVLSNSFSLNQADLVLARDPDPDHGRRVGMRLDLQYGQATETLQGNPANERRPEIYENIFQAYGSYVFPVGKGLQVDFGKWASSLGIEGNYTKDQQNYSRSFYFNFLPFYHQGVRASYHLNDMLSINYWIVNGTQQSEPTNSYKDELFGINLQPRKNINWTVNYYLGQDHPDTATATNCTGAPIQPGLCQQAITPAPNGKLHIFDSYLTWNTAQKLTLSAEGDYFIEREWANATPGESSAPSHVDGGALYAQYQLNPKLSIAARGEYLADPQGLFSNASQALKEGTATVKYQAFDGLDAFLEYRRDWSNKNYFLTDKPGALINSQPTVAVGVVWWYGGKHGAW